MNWLQTLDRHLGTSCLPFKSGDELETGTGATMCTLYDMLGVPRDASVSEIENAYRQRVAEYQARNVADMSRNAREGADNDLAWLEYAWQTLSDADARQEYDEQLRTSDGMSGAESTGELFLAEDASVGQQRTFWDIAFWIAVAVAVAGAVVYFSARR